MKHGVLTIFAAGNAGPHPSSLRNFSPWAVVVAASTLDRKFVTKIKLGDNRTYEVNNSFSSYFIAFLISSYD